MDCVLRLLYEFRNEEVQNLDDLSLLNEDHQPLIHYMSLFSASLPLVFIFVALAFSDR